MIQRLFVGFVLLVVLAGCGSGWGTQPYVEPTPPKVTYYQSDLHKETQLTFAEYNQGIGGSAYGDGVYLIVYEDDRDNDSGLYGLDIWASLLDKNLKPIKEFPIYKHDGRDSGATVFFDKVNHRFVVQWISYGAYVSVTPAVMVSFVGVDGSVSNAVKLPVSMQAASNSRLFMRPDGYALLFLDTWVTYSTDVGSTVLKFALLDWDLNVKSIQPVTDDTANGTKVIPLGAAIDCSDDFCVFAYAMTKNIMGRDGEHIFARVINMSDLSVGPELQVTEKSYTQAGGNTSAGVIYGGGSKFLVVWKDAFAGQGGMSGDIKGRFLTPDGTKSDIMLISDFRPDRSKDIYSGLGGVVESYIGIYRPSDNAIHFFWVDTRGGAPLDGSVLYRKIDDSFATNPVVLINNQLYDQLLTSVCLGESDKFFVTWLDHGQHMSQDWFGFLY